MIGENENQQQTLVGQRIVLLERSGQIVGIQLVRRSLAECQNRVQCVGQAEHERTAAGQSEHCGRNFDHAADKVQKCTHQGVGVLITVDGAERMIF